MANRTRNIVLRVPVTPEERALIQQKMAQLHTKNFSAYARKMLIDRYIVHMDTSDIRAQTAELQKIGVNVNQIARRIKIPMIFMVKNIVTLFVYPVLMPQWSSVVPHRIISLLCWIALHQAKNPAKSASFLL